MCSCRGGTFEAQCALRLDAPAGGQRRGGVHACSHGEPQPHSRQVSAFLLWSCTEVPAQPMLALSYFYAQLIMEASCSCVHDSHAGSSAPTPAVVRRYRVPRTLLVRFADDPIDETPLIAAALRRSRTAGGHGPCLVQLTPLSW